MIITKLKGGLGNQMFQYAAGFSLAHKNNVEHKIDISSYDKTPLFKSDTVRKFRLGAFNISSPIALTEEIQRIKYPHSYISKATQFLHQKLMRQFYLDYHPKLFKKIEKIIAKSKKDIYLEGFFQSEKNFQPHKDLILKEFTFKKELLSQNTLNLEKQIKSTTSVSIHIRRGDYAKIKKVRRYHGLLPQSYYLEAITSINQKIQNPTFYLFTDDPKWAHENFKINSTYFIISDQNLKDYEELYLMSACSHNIIANSSFSWWGAWLNRNHDKIVISPKKWINYKFDNHPNITPDTWTKI